MLAPRQPLVFARLASFVSFSWPSSRPLFPICMNIGSIGSPALGSPAILVLFSLKLFPSCNASLAGTVVSASILIGFLVGAVVLFLVGFLSAKIKFASSLMSFSIDRDTLSLLKVDAIILRTSASETLVVGSEEPCAGASPDSFSTFTALLAYSVSHHSDLAVESCSPKSAFALFFNRALRSWFLFFFAFASRHFLLRSLVIHFLSFVSSSPVR